MSRAVAVAMASGPFVNFPLRPKRLISGQAARPVPLLFGEFAAGVQVVEVQDGEQHHVAVAVRGIDYGGSSGLAKQRAGLISMEKASCKVLPSEIRQELGAHGHETIPQQPDVTTVK